MEKGPERRRTLVTLAALRGILAVVAIPAAPFLYDGHFLWLVLMRPTKEVFLFGAFLARTTEAPSLLLKVAFAGLPLAVGGVWLFYFLGRMYSKEVKSGDLPGVAGRLMPTRKISALGKVLKRKGPRLIFLGRLAAFPSSAVGAAAGATGVKSRQFLPADGLGAAVSIIEVMSIGYVLGGFFDPEDPVVSWTVTGAGILAAFALMFLLGRYLQKG
ncbi:hypothetical protein BH23ACT12_BH23ACT12_09220 [soil metagenome]